MATTAEWNAAKSTFGTGATGFTNTIGSTSTKYRHSVSRMGSKSNGYSGTVYTKWIIEETTLDATTAEINVYLAVWLKRGYWDHNRGKNLTTESSANWTTQYDSATKTSLKHRYSWRINGSEKIYLIIDKDYTTPTSWKRLYTGNTYSPNGGIINSVISLTNNKYSDYEHVYSTLVNRSKTTNNLDTFTIEFRRDSYTYNNEHGTLTWTGTTVTKQAPLWPYINVKYNTNGGTLSSSVSNPTKWYWNDFFSPSTAITKTGYTLSSLESSNKNYLPNLESSASTYSVKNDYPSIIGTEITLTAIWDETGTPAPPAITFNKNNYNIYETEDDTEGWLWYTYLSYNYTIHGSTSAPISLINGGPTKYVKMIDNSSVSLSNNYSQGFSTAKTSTYSGSVSSSKEIYYGYDQDDYQFISSLTNDYYIQTPFRTYSSTTERYSPIVENIVYGPASSGYIAKKVGSVYYINPSTKYDESISYFNWYARETSSGEWISICDNRKDLNWRKTFTPYEIKCEIINKDEWGQSTTITILANSIEEIPNIYFNTNGVLARKDSEQYDWTLYNSYANFCGFLTNVYEISEELFYQLSDEENGILTCEDGNYIIAYTGGQEVSGYFVFGDDTVYYNISPSSTYNYVCFYYDGENKEISYVFVYLSDLTRMKVKNKLTASRVKLWLEGNAAFKRKASNAAFKYIE